MTPLTHRPSPDLAHINEGVLETMAAVGGLSVGMGFAENRTRSWPRDFASALAFLRVVSGWFMLLGMEGDGATHGLAVLSLLVGVVWGYRDNLTLL